MKIEFLEEFEDRLFEIYIFIADDSVQRADRFIVSLKSRIENLVNFPYKYRKSHYHSAENIRDLIFKGYTIPYLVESKKIVILDIFKQNKP